MPLPGNFSPASHLISTIAQVVNKQVRDEFRDIGDDNWQRDIGTPRASLRTACTHLADDTIDMTLARMWLFYGALQKAKTFHPAIYGIPSLDFQSVMKFYPQVELFFEEKFSETERGYTQLRAQIKFRLVGETTETLTRADAIVLANKIKAAFNPNKIPFAFKKGKELYTYSDQEKGYHFQLYVFNKTVAQSVITKVLQLRGHAPNWKLMNLHSSSDPSAAYPTIPPTKAILGKPVRQPRIRPVGTVRFTYALVHLHGLPEPLVLYDPDKRYTKPLVK
jgi:hypothetical protein